MQNVGGNVEVAEKLKEVISVSVWALNTSMLFALNSFDHIFSLKLIENKVNVLRPFCDWLRTMDKNFM